MSPLWGFGYLVYAVFYKHAAPLGLKAAMHRNSRRDIHRRGEVTLYNGLGDPSPYDIKLPRFRASSAFLASLRLCVKFPSRFTPLNNPSNRRDTSTAHSACAAGFDMLFVRHGAKSSSPTAQPTSDLQPTISPQR